jgi:DNA polymerase-3 subunit chi
MSAIHFYGHADKQLHVAARWLSRAWKKRRWRSWVFTLDHAQAIEMDKLLWTHESTGFTPHCLLEHPLAVHTPILIGACAPKNLSAFDALVNLSDTIPSQMNECPRVIEVISEHDTARQLARTRYRDYIAQGHAVQYTDLSQGGTHA